MDSTECGISTVFIGADLEKVRIIFISSIIAEKNNNKHDKGWDHKFLTQMVQTVRRRNRRRRHRLRLQLHYDIMKSRPSTVMYSRDRTLTWLTEAEIRTFKQEDEEQEMAKVAIL